MNHKIEDLRRKAWVLYGGKEGVDRVNWEVMNAGVNEDNITPKMEKYLLNQIIKNVFIEYVGLERTKEIMATEIKHVRGYHTGDRKADQMVKIRILEKTTFIKILVVLALLGFFAFFGSIAYYATSFDPVDVCRAKTDPAEADQCYMMLGMNTANVTHCREIGNTVHKYNCFNQVGVLLNSSDICDEIPVTDIDLINLRDRCLTCVAFKLSSLRTCKKLNNYIKQAECESQIERGRSLVC